MIRPAKSIKRFALPGLCGFNRGFFAYFIAHAQILKEAPEDLRALLLHETGVDLDLVVELIVLENIEKAGVCYINF